jgi:hypothetical protein
VDADEWIETLQLAPHPEGGHYRETWRHDAGEGRRGAGTAIYYLLRAGERSAWHRVDAAELWHHYAGAPVALTIRSESGDQRALVLGGDTRSGARPQQCVPLGWWQTACLATEDPAAFALMGCTVSPAFEFAGFELAPPGFPQ